MCGGSSPVEKTCRGEKEGARADTRCTARRIAVPTHPGKVGLSDIENTRAADHHKGVHRPVQRRHGRNLDTLSASNLTACFGQHDGLVMSGLINTIRKVE